MPEPQARGGTIRGNALFAFAAQMSTAAFTAAITIFLTRELGPAGFGIFSLALSVTGLVLRPAGAGTTQAAGRYVAERFGDTGAVVGVLGMAIRLRTLTATATGVLLFALADPVAALYDTPALADPLRGMALAFVGQSLFDFFRTVFMALRRASTAFGAVASEAAMEAAATVALVLGGGGVAGAAYGRAAGYAFGAVVGVVLLGRVLGRSPLFRTGRSPVARREFAGYAGAMLVVASATSVFQRLAVLLLGAFLSVSAVGVYSAPLRLIAFIAYPGLALAQGVAPRQARHMTEPVRLAALVRALRYAVLFHASVVAFLLVWSVPIVELALGPEFSESGEVLRALTPFIFVNGMAPILFSSLGYAGEGTRRIPIALATVLVAAILYLTLIPAIGVVGAAFGTDIAYALNVGGHLWLAHRHLGLPLRPLTATLLRSALATGVAAAAVLVVGTGDPSTVQWLVGSIAGIAAFLSTAVLTRELNPGELRSLIRMPVRALRARRLGDGKISPPKPRQ